MNWFAAIIASLGVWIAFAQWWLAQQRLRMDLFDRRMRVIQAYRTIWEGLSEKGETLDIAAWKKYLVETAGARWLFDQSVESFLKAFERKINLLDLYIDEEFQKQVQMPTSEASREKTKLIEDLSNQMKSADNVFQPFMQINETSLAWLKRECLRAFDSWISRGSRSVTKPPGFP